MTHPKVVILSMTDISASTATGSLLRELFLDFPPDRLLQITASVSRDAIGDSYKNRAPLPEYSSRLYLRRRIWPVKAFSRNSRAARLELLEKVRTFEPDLVYLRVVEDLFPYLELARLISKQLGVPIVAHIMDDYEALLSLSESAFARILQRFFLRRDLMELFDAAEKSLAISQSMAVAFERRYGVPFDIFHNGIDPTDWLPAPTDIPGTAAKPFQLAMAGSIDEQKDAAVIARVAAVVGRLNDTGQLQCRLILNVPGFCLEKAEQLAKDHTGALAQSYVPIKQYRALLQESDCLVLARNSDDFTRAYTQYSFHNKLPEYMASGTPILCIGPEWDGSVQILSDLGAGVVLENADEPAIEAAILDMAANPGNYRGLAGVAREFAETEFDIKKIRRRFEEVLNRAIVAGKT